MATFAMSIDPFRSCRSWAAAHGIAQGAGARAIWAVVQFDDLPAFFVLFSQAVVGQNALSIHAEENVILNFETLLGRSTVYARALMRVCNIYLSHSPCTSADPNPSNHLQNYPVSCTAKLKVLARRFPLLQFNVYFNQTYRVLDEVTGPKHMGAVFLRMLDRLTPIFFKGQTPGHGSILLLQSLLQDFFPKFDILPADTRAVMAELQRMANDRGFNACLVSDPSEAASNVGLAILKTLSRGQGISKDNLKSSLRSDLSTSIMTRSVEIDQVPNLTIAARSFDDDPPAP